MRLRDRIALYLVGTVLVGAAFALGGWPRWAICLTSALAAAAAATSVTSQREMSRLSPLLAFVALAALLTLVQIVPLPAPVVEALSPGKLELTAANARSLGEAPPRWLSFSLDPPATLVELAKLAGHLAFAYAALRLAATPKGRRWLVTMVALVGTAMAVTAMAHRLTGADRVFGMYEPRYPQTPYVAPLLNKNHLAGLMALTAPLVIGLACTSQGRRRLAWIGAAAVCAAVALLAESRGGAVALLVSLVVVGGLVVAQRRRGAREVTTRRRSDTIAIAITAGAGLVLLGALTAGALLRDLAGSRLGEIGSPNSKFAAWRAAAPVLEEYRWTGIGRGAFEAVATSALDSRDHVFTHVENEYLQAAVDWGFVGGGALGLVFVWLAMTAIRRGRAGPEEAGALAGVIGLAVANLTDFSLWMPGVAYPAIAVIATLVFVPLATDTARARHWWRPLRAAGIAMVAAAAALAASPLGRSARAETDELAASRRRSPTPEATLARARRILARHPADYVAAAMTAEALFELRDRRAIAVANRALALHPTSGDLHRLAARMLLASQQPDQAGVEYALALRYAPREEILDEVLMAFPRDDDAVHALPLDPKMAYKWTNRLANRGRMSLALAYLNRYLAVYPEDVRMLLHASATALNAGQLDLAERAAERAHALDGGAAAIIALGNCRTARRQPDQAVSLLAAALADTTRPQSRRDRFDLLVALAVAQRQTGSLDAARETLLTAMTVADRDQAADLHRKLAEIEAELGNEHQADWARERAGELDR